MTESLLTDTPSGERGPSAEGEVSSGDRGSRLYQAGDIIAQKYRLTRLLGEGGMGAVWLARNIKLDVDVAIKLIRHELGTSEASDRLLQEARAAARIGHPSIVRIFDYGETELDDPFIVMELLSGDSLRVLLERKGRLSATNAVRTLLPIASALAEAHASGIVHRDLKPENVMLVPDKSGSVVPKLVDFGIAKFHRDSSGDEDERPRAYFAGTPDYMAPEQAGGRDPVGEAADVWALAVILYEAITGKVPFGGPTGVALIFAIMTAEPAPIQEQVAGDAELWEILQPALAKQASARPTMRAFGTALARWALERGVESDIAGTSLLAHWLNEAGASPFSVLPPPVSELSIPRPAGLPAGWRAGDILAPTESPPAENERPPASSESKPTAAPVIVETRPRSAVWPLITIASTLVAAVAIVIAQSKAVTMGPQAAPNPALPSAAPVMSTSASGPAPVEAAPADRAPEDVAATSKPSADPAPTASPDVNVAASASAAPPVKPGLRKNPRKSSLPIAKQPHF
jgi:serine/threonine-protein kinase